MAVMDVDVSGAPRLHLLTGNAREQGSAGSAGGKQAEEGRARKAGERSQGQRTVICGWLSFLQTAELCVLLPSLPGRRRRPSAAPLSLGTCSAASVLAALAATPSAEAASTAAGCGWGWECEWLPWGCEWAPWAWPAWLCGRIFWTPITPLSMARS